MRTVVLFSHIRPAFLLLALMVSPTACGRHSLGTQSITTINLLNVGVDGKQQFQEIRSKKDLPPEVMKWFAGGIADPGEKYAATDVADSRLPRRRLFVAGKSSTYCIVNYERGGIAHDYVFILFSLDQPIAKPLWTGGSGKIDSLSALKTAIESGKLVRDSSPISY